MAALGLALEIFGPAALVAGVTTLVVALLGPCLFSPTANERFTFPAALAIGYCAGYAALPWSRAAFSQLAGAIDAREHSNLQRMWTMIAPEQPWQWLPYLGVAVAAVGTAAQGRHWALRWLALSTTAILSGSLLTPTWAIFGVPWPASIGILSAYLLCIAAMLELLPSPLSVHALVALLALVAAVTAVCVAAAISVRFAQLASLAAAALAGCWLAGFAAGKPMEGARRGLIPIFVVLVGGVAFTACVEPERPLLALLVLPALPLATSPFARRTIG